MALYNVNIIRKGILWLKKKEERKKTMKFLSNNKCILVVMILCLLLFLSGCGDNKVQNLGDGYEPIQSSQGDVEPEVFINYGDAESFEADLNKGNNLEGKVVQFIAGEFHPNSELGYNVWAGEHLNFVSSRNPDIQEGDTVTAKVTTIENIGGSWVINYEKVKNAISNDDTITLDRKSNKEVYPKETGADKLNSESSSSKEDTLPKNDTVEPTVSDENTYEHNEYYDIVETSTYQDSIGYTIIVHKVLAKKDVTISSTLLASLEDGSIIGKSSDDITLTEGEYNFFKYSFEGDISSAQIQANAKSKSDSFLTGERKAVEMVKYNRANNDLFVTFEQTGDQLSSFSRFKLLLYKDDTIVGTENGHFSIYAENLNGKGTTDVAKFWVYGIDFDRVEYIFEP